MPYSESLFRRALARRIEQTENEAAISARPSSRPSVAPNAPAVAIGSGIRARSSAPPSSSRYSFRPTRIERVNPRQRLAMIVEDDEKVRAAIGAMLAEAGWQVIGASTFDDARRVLASVRPDVMVLDYEVDGEYASAFLDELARSPRPVSTVLVSASPLAVDAAAGYGVELLEEPFSIDDLADAIRRVSLTHGSVPRMRAAM